MYYYSSGWAVITPSPSFLPFPSPRGLFLPLSVNAWFLVEGAKLLRFHERVDTGRFRLYTSYSVMLCKSCVRYTCILPGILLEKHLQHVLLMNYCTILDNIPTTSVSLVSCKILQKVQFPKYFASLPHHHTRSNIYATGHSVNGLDNTRRQAGVFEMWWPIDDTCKNLLLSRAINLPPKCGKPFILQNHLPYWESWSKVRFHPIIHCVLEWYFIIYIEWNLKWLASYIPVACFAMCVTYITGLNVLDLY